MRRNYLLKYRMKGQIVWEMILPLVTGACLRLVGNAFRCPLPTADQTPSAPPSNDPVIIAPGQDLSCPLGIVRDIILPFLLCVYVPNLTALSARFILQTMVEDKQTKMRETLKLMSLS